MTAVRIHHVAIYVCDLERARRFFEDYFGGVAGERYNNVATGFSSYFISLDGFACIEIMTRPEVDVTAPRGLYDPGYAHMAISLGSRKAVDAMTRRLADDGYELLSGPRVTGDGYYESCMLIFDGIIIELCE